MAAKVQLCISLHSSSLYVACAALSLAASYGFITEVELHFELKQQHPLSWTRLLLLLHILTLLLLLLLMCN